MALNNFKLYQTNKIESYSTYSGTGLNSSTIAYLVDNSVYSGIVTWTSGAGTLNISVANDISVTKAFLCYHNLYGNLQYLNSAAAWVTISAFQGTFSNNGFSYMDFATVTAKNFKIAFSSDGAYVGVNLYNNPVLGEFILTDNLNVNNMSATLSYNPDYYSPRIELIGSEIVTINGKKDFIVKDKRFKADIGYNYCIGDSTFFNASDITIWQGLIFNKQKFLFWPNANSTSYPNVYGFKPYEIFKCQVTGDVSSSFPVDGNLDIIGLNFTVEDSI